jgi:RNA polymerase sporulation-specific sigma factor
LTDITPELLLKVKNGDESAFSFLAEKYAGITEKSIRRFAPSFGITDGGADAVIGLDDLRQCAYMALYRAASTYRADEEGKAVSFGLYAKICVNNALISELRHYESEKRRALRMQNNAERSRRGGHDPLTELVSSENASDLLSQIESVLSAFEKEVFDAYISGKSVCEIAEGLGKSEKSISNALYRMKTKIKGLLRNQ